MKAKLVLCFGLLLTMQAYADTFDITIVGVDLSQQTFFIGVGQTASTSPCGRKDEFKWSLQQSGIKEIESIALAAKSLGKNRHWC